MTYSDEALASAVESSISYAEVLRKLEIRQAGGSQRHLKSRIEAIGLSTEHFLGQGHNRNKVSSKRKTASEYLVLRESGQRQKTSQLRRSLVESSVTQVCTECGLSPEWNGKPLVLQIDHKNRNWLDDRIENLRFLCPNCHSQASAI